MRSDLALERDWARHWLLEDALPLWWAKGADHERGGWFDKLDQHGDPIDLPKRLRVQARQTFVYAQSGASGWDGPWHQATKHGIDFMLDRFRRPDGLFRAAVSRDGEPLIERPDLYDQAFVLFALAKGYVALGRPTALIDEAMALLNRLEALLAHVQRGFEEANPRLLPLRSNPHMHLLEALLAWVDAESRPQFEHHARAIVELALERLIDPATGAIGEYYDGDWAFASDGGAVREPGHQFEWAYLLHRAERMLGGDHSVARDRLHRFGTKYGVRDGRAIFSVAADGRELDGSSRLWAQTERLRTMLVLAPLADEAEAKTMFDAAAQSFKTIHRFLDVPVRGLWFDRADAGGLIRNEPAPASTLYHLVTGLTSLIEMDDRDRAQPVEYLLTDRSAS